MHEAQIYIKKQRKKQRVRGVVSGLYPPRGGGVYKYHCQQHVSLNTCDLDIIVYLCYCYIYLVFPDFIHSCTY